MFRFMRTATAKNAASLPAALQFAGEVTSYLNKRYSLNMKFGIEMFGAPRVHWHFESDSLDKMHQLNIKLTQDREYLGMLEKFKDVWADASMRDTILAFPE